MSETTTANKAIVTRLVQEVLNDGQLDVIDDLYAPEQPVGDDEVSWNRQPNANSDRRETPLSVSRWPGHAPRPTA